MKNILIDPNPFCYGSIADAIAIAKRLQGYHLSLFVMDSSKELADASIFNRIIPANVKNPEFLKDYDDVVNEASLYIAISNNSSINYVHGKGIPIIFIDALFWMHDSKNLALTAARKYFILNFPGVLAKLNASNNLPDSYEVIPPLGLDTRPRETEGKTLEKKIMINLGGGESPYVTPGKNSCYAQMIGEILKKELARKSKYEVTICGGDKSMEIIRPIFGNTKVKVGKLRKRDFDQELRDASVFITTPGTNAPFEAIAQGIPTYFLPAQNLSQEFQLEVYIENGIAMGGLLLRELDCQLELQRYASEKVQTELILDSLYRIHANEKASGKISVAIRSYLQGCNPTLVVEQKKWRTQYLAPSSEDIIVDYICSIL